MATSTITIYWKKIADFYGQPFYHEFLLYDGGSGNVQYVRGGPSSKYGDNTANTCPDDPTHGHPPLGHVAMGDGEYDRFSPDYFDSTDLAALPHRVLLSRPAGSLQSTWEQILTAAAEVDGVNTPPAKAGGFGLRLEAGFVGLQPTTPPESHHQAREASGS